jgi:hypothetical protein
VDSLIVYDLWYMTTNLGWAICTQINRINGDVADTCLATKSLISASCKSLPERPTTNATGSSPACSSGYLHKK